MHTHAVSVIGTSGTKELRGWLRQVTALSLQPTRTMGWQIGCLGAVSGLRYIYTLYSYNSRNDEVVCTYFHFLIPFTHKNLFSDIHSLCDLRYFATSTITTYLPTRVKHEYCMGYNNVTRSWFSISTYFRYNYITCYVFLLKLRVLKATRCYCTHKFVETTGNLSYPRI